MVRLPARPAASAILRAVGEEPTMQIPRTRGSSYQAVVGTWSPCTTLTTPGGSPICPKISHIFCMK